MATAGKAPRLPSGSGREPVAGFRSSHPGTPAAQQRGGIGVANPRPLPIPKVYDRPFLDSVGGRGCIPSAHGDRSQQELRACRARRMLNTDKSCSRRGPGLRRPSPAESYNVSRWQPNERAGLSCIRTGPSAGQQDSRRTRPAHSRPRPVGSLAPHRHVRSRNELVFVTTAPVPWGMSWATRGISS